jgi:hypothetical protein
MTPEEEAQFKRARRGRNIALALVLAAFVVLFYAITIVKSAPLMASLAVDQKNRRVALIVLAGGCGHARPRLRRRAALPHVLPGDRLSAAPPRSRPRPRRPTPPPGAPARRRSRSASTPTTASDMPWIFRPRQVTDTVQIGQRDMAIFEARNLSSVPVTGTASFNVEPEQAGATSTRSSASASPSRPSGRGRKWPCR